jgi:AcrR family transcriptional regulator
MPRETFFNLSEEKRARVLDAALTEFASHTFHQATVDRIVEGAGISKGSFYQYFGDKKDLYRYLVKMSQEKKLDYIKRTLKEEDNTDIFSQLRGLYSAGVRFAQDNPQLLAIGQNLWKEEEEFLQEVMDQALPEAQDFLEDMLKRGLQAGEIDPECNLAIAASLITSFNLTLIDLLLQSPIEEGMEQFLSRTDDMIYILRHGLGRD